MLQLIRRAGLLMLLMGTASNAEKRGPVLPSPDEFAFGRHTYFDFGPPFNYYEVFVVRSVEGGSSIERLIVTPHGDTCTQPASLEVAAVSVRDSVSDLLGNKNPCSIPEKALRQERKRCKKCLVFSGANVVMQVQCGGQQRQIRMDILDRDLFDAAPQTPEHTSWTMQVLRRLDEAAGPGVMERPMFSVPAASPSTVAPESQAIAGLRQGTFDGLFQGAPDKPSILYLESQKVPPRPVVELQTISPFRPLAATVPDYPPIAKLAHVEGEVSFKLAVTSEGSASEITVLSGHPLLSGVVVAQIAKWQFSPEAASQRFEGSIQFKMNCPVPNR